VGGGVRAGPDLVSAFGADDRGSIDERRGL